MVIFSFLIRFSWFYFLTKKLIFSLETPRRRSAPPRQFAILSHYTTWLELTSNRPTLILPQVNPALTEATGRATSRRPERRRRFYYRAGPTSTNRNRRLNQITIKAWFTRPNRLIRVASAHRAAGGGRLTMPETTNAFGRNRTTNPTN